MTKNNQSESLTRIETTLNQVMERLDQMMAILKHGPTTKAAYTPAEVAAIVGRRPYTVRNWCRLKRINAKKRTWGQGDKLDWEISHKELERLRSHGLLPVPKHY